MACSHQACRRGQFGRYQAAYNDAGERVEPGSFKAISLIPHGRKDFFVPDIEPFDLIEEAGTFAALSLIDWDADEAQLLQQRRRHRIN